MSDYSDYNFAGHIPDWLKKIPGEVLSFTGLSGIYGLNLYCRAGITGVAAILGLAGGPGMATLLGTGGIIGVEKLRCDQAELNVIHGVMCENFNKKVCPKHWLDIRKVRHPSISLETDETTLGPKKCPPCPETAENKQVSQRVMFGEGDIGSVGLDTSLVERIPDFAAPAILAGVETAENKQVSQETDVEKVVSEKVSVSHSARVMFGEGDIGSVGLDTSIAERIPDFAAPARVYQQCPDLSALVDLDKAFDGSVDDPEVSSAICRLLQAQEPIPISCLPPKLTLDQMVNFDVGGC